MIHVQSVFGPAMQVGDWCLVKDEDGPLFGCIQDINMDLGVVFLTPYAEGCISGAPFLLNEIVQLATKVRSENDSIEPSEMELVTLGLHFSADN